LKSRIKKMEKPIEQILKVFSHLGREIQIYVFSGLVVATNIIIIDYFYYESSFLNFIQINHFILPSIVLLYLLGHFCMGFYFLLLEHFKFDKKIKKILKFEIIDQEDELPMIYKKDDKIYNFFIERNNILLMMRWTLSAACCINFFSNLVFLSIKKFHWQFLLITIIVFNGIIVFYLLSAQSEEDYSKKINQIKKL